MRNGTIYHTPTEESVTAAKLVLEGADVAGESLYFLAPTLTNNHWIMENRDYIMTIGVQVPPACPAICSARSLR